MLKWRCAYLDMSHCRQCEVISMPCVRKVNVSEKVGNQSPRCIIRHVLWLYNEQKNQQEAELNGITLPH